MHVKEEEPAVRSISSLFLGLVAALLVSVAAAQEYPARPVRIVVPYAPGGLNDIAARIMGNKLSEFWKQSVIVDNRAGGGGIIGTDAVAKATPDGYTMLMGSVSEYAITHHMYAKFPLNPLKDFTPIVIVGENPMVFSANVSAPFNNVREMMAYANAQQGGLPYASAGIGSLSHLIAERFAFESRTKMLNVPYKGGGPAGAALAGGEVLLGSFAASSVISYVKAGRMKVIAVTTAQRIPLGPDWPTVAESGAPGFEASNWTAMVAPAGTPRDIIMKINADANRALKTADVRERLAAVGSDAAGSTPEELGTRIAVESERYGKLIKLINIKLD
jgi:tripartite-type tricarboxylate transporter receptor subunit TctC